jgi:hypothetical protein
MDERMENIMNTKVKPASRDQAVDFVGRVGTDTDWNAVNGDTLQRVLEMQRGRSSEFSKRLVAFINNECRFVIKSPSTVIIDRAKPFDPVRFCDVGWEVLSEDRRSLALTEIDFSHVSYEHCIEDGEETITGKEKLKRMKHAGFIRLDAKFAQALYEEPGQVLLRWLYDTFGITHMEFAGTELRGSEGNRCFLCLNRHDSSSWDQEYHWLEEDRDRISVSPVLAGAKT